MKKLQIITILTLLILGFGFNYNKDCSAQQPLSLVANQAYQQPQITYTIVNPLTVVLNPNRYINQNIKIKAKFDKFTTLGLDYAPAMRSSEKFITFLIQRPDVTNHNIPLSELKIFLKKEIAEKNINLDAGDEIEFTGRVFSSALGDAWMDVDNFKVINKIKKDNENTANK